MRHLMMFLLAVSGCSIAAPAPALTFPDRGRAGVVDAAHVLPDAARNALNRKVVAWDRATGHQLVVATVPDLQGADVKDYGYQLGRAWGLGDKKRNDGVILLLTMAERKVRIEVGYGLEGDLTDAATSVIVHERIVPRLREGDIPTALADGADAIMAAAGPAAPQAITAPAKPGGGWFADWWPVLAILGACGVWIWFCVARERRRARQEAERAAAAREAAARRTRPAAPFTMPRDVPMPPYRYQPTHTGSGSASAPRTTIVAPIITPAPSYTSPSRSDDSSSSSGWGGFGSSSDSSSSSSSWDSGGSSGFDSGGGSFGGGGSDGSW